MSSLNKLINLRISDSNIEDTYVLSLLTKLRSLTLSESSLHCIPTTLTSLRTLLIFNSKINISILNMSKLNTLYIAPPATINCESFKEWIVPKLRTLELYSPVPNIELSDSMKENLEGLTLNIHNMTSLPQSIYQCKKLNSILLESYNHERDHVESNCVVSDDLMKLKTLRRFKTGKNVYLSASEFVLRFISVTNDHLIRYFHPNYYNLKLKVEDIDDIDEHSAKIVGHITFDDDTEFVPDSIAKFTNLRMLTIKRDKIKWISPCITKLELKEINFI